MTEPTFSDLYESRAKTIVSGFLKQKLNVRSSTVLNVKKKRKSIFGGLIADGTKYFYKISTPARILSELKGYELAREYPHEKIIAHGINDEFGIYLQDFVEEGEGGLLQNKINLALFREDDQQLLSRTKDIFSTIGDIYDRTLTPPTVSDGRNDIFFYDRLSADGRLRRIYFGKEISFASGDRMTLERFLGHTIFLDNGRTGLVPMAILERATKDLSPRVGRRFVISTGDLTETNITINGDFFDFEVGGYNSFAQDVAVFAAYNLFGGHYMIPKYSALDGRSEDFLSVGERENLEKFMETIGASYEFDASGKNRLFISMKFPFPPVKRAIMGQFNDLVVRRIEGKISDAENRSMVDIFRASLIARLLAVKNILRFDEQDLLVTIGLMAHLSDGTEYARISDFITDKFRSI